eukprot:TRINITY_DN2481_c0_g1_i1.p1 TRINITY_DN2481_c0_g1~~TRINITY_DN2481_c0_g1_i1.p1  ORF type:complete len:402 (+),score=94.56 TRINITY_DN2481_c0_g1_i1:78-1208(+)
MMRVALLCGAIVGAQAACPSTFTVGMCNNECTGQCFPQITKAPVPSPTVLNAPTTNPTRHPTRSPWRATPRPTAPPTLFPSSAPPTPTPPPTGFPTYHPTAPTSSPIRVPTRHPTVSSPTASPVCPDVTAGKCNCDCVGVPTVRIAFGIPVRDSAGNVVAVGSTQFIDWINSFEQKFFRDFREAAIARFTIPEIQSAADFDNVFKGFKVHHACYIPRSRLSSKASQRDLEWSNRCYVKEAIMTDTVRADRHADTLQTLCDLDRANTWCEVVIEFSVINHYRPGWDTSLSWAATRVLTQIRTAGNNLNDGSFMKDHNDGRRARWIVNDGIWVPPTLSPAVGTTAGTTTGTSGIPSASSNVVPFLLGCIAAVGATLVA